ncbi:homoserine O-acetyltransferase [Marinithermofilum abyssi]|uniref:Homoserine O-acetyltransferase n=1 Tax=Marinithermofilum abyssi TaxID=1571185 RepID=A0A8J2YDK9_9BACL|nr:homoserine O-acetyltransferase [Marinithermofilum abyssi]GGE18038.1 homoserine O-acetyltransferase [Marinithermofilum abyssi]
MPAIVHTAAKQTVDIGPFTLECGDTLPQVEIAVETAGTLNAAKDNVILVCHALTGDAHAVGDEEQPGWWDGLIGPGRFVDTSRYFVVTMNTLGGCHGSTGPASISPDTGKPYGGDFPLVTIRDMVRAQRRCLDRLGLGELHTVIGGSMGGMMVLEWAVMYPGHVKKVVPIATAAALTSVAVGYNEAARHAIQSDPGFQGGHYYPGPGPVNGLAVARMIGMITYRTEALFEKKFSRRLQEGTNSDIPSLDSLFQVGSYLRYQGEKLVHRFDANSYLRLLKAMDTHDLARGRGSLEAALSRVKAEVLTVGIREDLLFPYRQQEELHRELVAAGKSSRLIGIHSDYGHDAFLVEYSDWGPQLQQFLEE